MVSKVQFDKRVAGHDALFNEPFWLSKCGRYRLAKMDCVRPFRLFRRLRKGFKSGGWPWIGVGSGFGTKDAAIVAANQHRAGFPVD